MTIILDGRKTSNKVMEEVTSRLEELDVIPGLALVLTGDDKFSARYVKLKKRKAEEVGIYAEFHHLEETTQEELNHLIRDLNDNPKIHGIMVQLPLGEGLDELETVNAIKPEKDVDGLSPNTLGKIVMGEDAYLPAGVEAIMELFRRYELDPENKHWVVVGSSNFLSKPLVSYLCNMEVQVTFCKETDPTYKDLIREADVINTEIFEKHVIKSDMLKEGVIVIDNGNTYEGKKVFGDIDTDEVMDKVKAITPVPGGTGPMLISMLLRNTVKAAEAAQ
jgi:methylenetetrahydrofolate dehydrogenase (NADP+)/methenyltetrahydrofolate cyclohydrolase